MVVLVSAPAAKHRQEVRAGRSTAETREQFVRELRLSPTIDVRDDFKPSGSETAFSIEGTISNMSRRTTSRGELEVSLRHQRGDLADARKARRRHCRRRRQHRFRLKFRRAALAKIRSTIWNSKRSASRSSRRLKMSFRFCGQRKNRTY